jgi:hypothetical protein
MWNGTALVKKTGKAKGKILISREGQAKEIKKQAWLKNAVSLFRNAMSGKL